jgi:hypothetical protein
VKLSLSTLLILIAAFTVACGVSATPTPGPAADPTPTATPVATATPTPVGDPAWLAALIATFEAEGAANPPIKISEYIYNGVTVYFVPQRCCDIFSDLYDASGTLIAHPDGGIAGIGDGKAPDFATNAKFVRFVWEDPRGLRESVLAPIESVEVEILESFPVQYRVRVVSGLPNGCARFDRWTVGFDEAARLFTIEVLNSVPTAAADLLCTMVYGTVDHSIPIDGVKSGLTYEVQVHDQTATFTGQ